MKDGFIKIACATPDIKVADCVHNSEQILELIKEANAKGVKAVCFPELCITGYTCGDLFLQSVLLDEAENALIKLAENTADMDIVCVVGLPLVNNGKLYNCAGVFHKGKILGAVPKVNLPNYSEFYEARHFTKGVEQGTLTLKNGVTVPFGTDNIFSCENFPNFRIGIEICEDLWVADTPSVKLAQNGATVIFNLSASDETIGKADYRRSIVKAKSGSLLCVYAYTDAGIGESTTDMIFAGHNMIYENGSRIAESKKFETGLITGDIDIDKMVSERRRSTTFRIRENDNMNYISFRLEETETAIERYFAKTPFVPDMADDRNERCEEILNMQAVGLMTRLRHIGCKNAVLGLSGGLDSTLALIVAVHAFDMLGLDRKGIITVTMPCFGTTDRTYTNACRLAEGYGATLKEINIKESVKCHFKDIGQSESVHDVTYENSQARERTQVLMDIANQQNGIVIGTGDLSELALGWATYNGDHMSMYAVNASIPKTLVRWLVKYEADVLKDSGLKAVLNDVLDTPVSPELLPPEENGNIAQKTEDVVGPYELHDFFLYYMLRFGYSPLKIYRIAKIAFRNTYEESVILKWEKTFIRRFFSQQFKRSCLPDAPKVGSVTLSPRGDFRMPSDASARLWLDELNNIKL